MSCDERPLNLPKALPFFTIRSVVRKPNRLRPYADMMRNLVSERDAKILGYLLGSDGGISSQKLSEKVGISLAAARIRRGELAEKYLIVTYSLNLKKYGWRQLQLMVSTGGGRTTAIGRELLKHKQVVHVARTVGQGPTVDLRAEVFVRSSQELLDLLEEVRAVDGVKSVIWREDVEVVGSKKPPPQLKTHIGTMRSPQVPRLDDEAPTPVP